MFIYFLRVLALSMGFTFLAPFLCQREPEYFITLHMQELMIYFALQEECQLPKLKKIVYTKLVMWFLHHATDVTSKKVFKLRKTFGRDP